MRTLKGLLLAGFGLALLLAGLDTVSVQGKIASNNSAAPTEAPAGFDGKTNGLVDETTHEADSAQFSEVEDIPQGLGPTYNAQACRECHQNPIVGGISQIKEIRAGHLDPKGEFVAATVHLSSGEIVAGRSLINQRAICPQAQERVEDRERIRAFRTSLNTLGDGFVEAIADETLLEIAEEQCRKTGGQICGQAIYVPILELKGATAVGRFGWKDQHASLLSFSGDAYLNEMGISNRLQPQDVVTTCKTTKDPDNTDPAGAGFEDVDKFAQFMRASKVPPRDPKVAATDEAREGAWLFHKIGCATCHVSQLVTAPAGTPVDGGAFTVPKALGNKIIHPFSDFLLHDVGTGDGIVQNGGQETADKLRTPPLWGVRTRPELMHDGASLTFNEAILRHAGEASQVIERFRVLTPAQKQAVISFLESL